MMPRPRTVAAIACPLILVCAFAIRHDAAPEARSAVAERQVHSSAVVTLRTTRDDARYHIRATFSSRLSGVRL